MSRFVRIAIAALIGALAFAVTSGCTRVPLDDAATAGGQTWEPALALDGAQELDVTLRMGAGELQIDALEANTGNVMDARFGYAAARWAPEVDYEVDEDGRGQLDVGQPSQEFRFGENSINEWAIDLTPDVPMDLEVRLGAGEAGLALGGLAISDLVMSLGAGDTTIDLTGEWTDDLDARIEAGVGSLTIIVPSDVGVRVFGRQDGLGDFEADGMITDGNYVRNDAYGESDVTLELRVQRGLGDVRIELAE